MKQNRTTGATRLTSKIRRYQKLDAVRERIDEVDAHLASLLAERLALANEIATVKADLKLGIKDQAREQEVLAKVGAISTDANITESIKEIYQTIFVCSRQLQQRDRERKTGPLLFPPATIIGLGTVDSKIERKKGRTI